MTRTDIKILFVCLGNICRSPLAEGIFLDKIEKEGLGDRVIVDSAGTGNWHVNELPDPRTHEVAGKHGITLTSPARQIMPRDLKYYDYILVMDHQNLENTRKLLKKEETMANIHLMREFDPQAESGAEVPDPYWGGEDHFEEIYEILNRSCDGLISELKSKHNL